MQSSLFAHGPVQSQDRWALQNSQMLKIDLGGQMRDVLARKGTMVAFQGGVDFDGHLQSGGERMAATATGEELNLMRCFGAGTVYLANLAQSIHVLDLNHEGITVDGQYVLALDPTLSWNVVRVESDQGIAAVGGGYNLEIGGQGKLAIMTSGKPLVMQVTPQQEVFADADAVVAWSTSLVTRMEAQLTSQRVWSRRGGTGEGWNMSFQGQGYVLVQPSELLPPTVFQQAAQGFLANRGLGQQGGMRGNTWGA
ncbi:AIM24 family protein [Yinghuangia seranimata]|uniref:AIM24 family protein n=1 Tax=Yinghuangia seranimata TaxID=408067 RepID=UPI00248BD356|nr:AIM24 family protein [Yinghuangia seranimata]MDI2128028.1 AIM24 family protein [Yinghuangia seranimata]